MSEKELKHGAFALILIILLVIGILGLVSMLRPSILGMAGRECVSPEDSRELTSSTTFCNGSYYLRDAGSGALLISGDNVSLDCNGAELAGDETGKGIIIEGENVEIKNCKIKDYQIGIYVFNVSDISITDSEINDTEHGVHATLANSLTISNIDVLGSKEGGIYLYEVTDSKVDMSKIEGSNKGVHLIHVTEDVTISNSIISDCADAIFIESSPENTVCNSNIENSSRGVVAKTVRGLKMFNNSVSENNAVGIILLNVYNSEFTGNTITSNKDGILVSDAHANIFFANYIKDNLDNGMSFGETSKNNKMHHNAFINNPKHVSTTPIGNEFYVDINGTNQGNYWDDMASLIITDTDNDSYGDSGRDYPYKSGKVGLAVEDRGPIIQESTVGEQNLTIPEGCEYNPKSITEDVTKAIEVTTSLEAPEEDIGPLDSFVNWLKGIFTK